MVSPCKHTVKSPPGYSFSISCCLFCTHSPDTCSFSLVLAGPQNVPNLDVYGQYRRDFAVQTGNDSTGEYKSPQRVRDQYWSLQATHTLLAERCKTSPSSFVRISEHLNNLEYRRPTRPVGSRPFTKSDCLNKWAELIPATVDIRTTMQFLKLLERLWPGTKCVCEPGEGSSSECPSLKAIHVIWPWCRSVLEHAGKSLFCDGTFHVTIYIFKLVCLTTLDGNHHHRPLMFSFITDSNTPQWTTIFNLFFE